MTSCIRGKRRFAGPQGFHGRDRTTPRLYCNTLRVCQQKVEKIQFK